MTLTRCILKVAQPHVLTMMALKSKYRVVTMTCVMEAMETSIIATITSSWPLLLFPLSLLPSNIKEKNQRNFISIFLFFFHLEIRFKRRTQ